MKSNISIKSKRNHLYWKEKMKKQPWTNFEYCKYNNVKNDILRLIKEWIFVQKKS